MTALVAARAVREATAVSEGVMMAPLLTEKSLRAAVRGKVPDALSCRPFGRGAADGQGVGAVREGRELLGARAGEPVQNHVEVARGAVGGRPLQEALEAGSGDGAAVVFSREAELEGGLGDPRGALGAREECGVDLWGGGTEQPR